jgi:hypothetical protein
MREYTEFYFCIGGCRFLDIPFCPTPLPRLSACLAVLPLEDFSLVCFLISQSRAKYWSKNHISHHLPSKMYFFPLLMCQILSSGTQFASMFLNFAFIFTFNFLFSLNFAFIFTFNFLFSPFSSLLFKNFPPNDIGEYLFPYIPILLFSRLQ